MVRKSTALLFLYEISINDGYVYEIEIDLLHRYKYSEYERYRTP
jgi:hypothetical protein